MIKQAKLMIMTTILVSLFTNCSMMIVKPVYLYEDKALYKQIKKEKKDLIKEPSVQKVNTILNHYDTYSDKAHKVMSENNKRALK